jgi:hypothetical protein
MRRVVLYQPPGEGELSSAAARLPFMSPVLDHSHVPGVHALPAPKTGMCPQAIPVRKSSALYVSSLPFGQMKLRVPSKLLRSTQVFPCRTYATSDSPVDACWMVPVTHAFPFLPRIVVTPEADEILAPLDQHSVSDPSAPMSWLHVPFGWKHLNALRVQLFLKTHFAPAGATTARSRSNENDDVRTFCVRVMSCGVPVQRYLVKNRGAANARLTIDHAGD